MGKKPRDFTRLTQTFLYAKSFTKNLFVFLLAQVFFFSEAFLINLFLKGFKEKVLC